MSLFKKSTLSMLLSTVVFAPSATMAMEMSEDNHDMENVMRLVRISDVTHTSVQSGTWHNASTWENGIVPDDGARVLIQSGHTVDVRQQYDERIQTLRVQGKLRFVSGRNTELKVDTMYIDMNGELSMGTAGSPIKEANTARLIFDDITPFITDDINHPDYDPYKFGLGLISMGTVSIHGTNVTPSATSDGVLSGESTITLDNVPSDWKVGDTIVVAGTQRDALGDEKRTISAISGNNVTVTTPFSLDHTKAEHTVPGLDLKIHVINLRRNVEIITLPGNETVMEKHYEIHAKDYSAPEEFYSRGHIMMMNNNASINNAYFGFLGRNNKLWGANVTTEDAEGNITHIGVNPIARYPIHFHRSNTEMTMGRALVQGNAVEDSWGWGVVNHSAAVDVINNVAYDIKGAAFVSEAGDEQGSFIDNISIRNIADLTQPYETRVGPSRNIDGVLDQGGDGHGFWLTSHGMEIRGNVASGSAAEGFAIAGEGIDGADERGVLVSALAHPEQFSPDAFVEPDEPSMIFEDNTAYGSSSALQMHKNSGNAKNWDMIDGFIGWSVQDGVRFWYSHRLMFRETILIGDRNDPSGNGLHAMIRTDNIGRHVYQRPHVEGFDRGVVLPGKFDYNLLDGATLDNLTNFGFGKRLDRSHKAKVIGDIVFQNTLAQPQIDFLSHVELHSTAMNAWITELPASTLQLPGSLVGRSEELLSVYLKNEQAGGYVPYPTATIDPDIVNVIPAQWLDKSNRQIAKLADITLDDGSIALGAQWSNGGKAPSDAVVVANSNSTYSANASSGDQVNMMPIRTGWLDAVDANGQSQVDIDLSGIFYDAEGDTLIYSLADSYPAGAVQSVSFNGDTATVNLASGASGQVWVSIIANDHTNHKAAERDRVGVFINN